jgi:hypothetical protein
MAGHRRVAYRAGATGEGPTRRQDSYVVPKHAGHPGLANAQEVRAISHTRVKMDVRTLAHLMRAGMLDAVWVPDPGTQALRRSRPATAPTNTREPFARVLSPRSSRMIGSAPSPRRGVAAAGRLAAPRAGSGRPPAATRHPRRAIARRLRWPRPPRKHPAWWRPAGPRRPPGPRRRTGSRRQGRRSSGKARAGDARARQRDLSVNRSIPCSAASSIAAWRRRAR